MFAGIGTTFGPTSPQRSFFTGPECSDGSESHPPTLASPVDGGVVTTLTPWLHFTVDTGSCIPGGIAIYLETDAEFAGADPHSTFNFPGTTFIRDPRDDCATYSWRVAPIQDDFVLP